MEKIPNDRIRKKQLWEQSYGLKEICIKHKKFLKEKNKLNLKTSPRSM